MFFTYGFLYIRQDIVSGFPLRDYRGSPAGPLLGHWVLNVWLYWGAGTFFGRMKCPGSPSRVQLQSTFGNRERHSATQRFSTNFQLFSSQVPTQRKPLSRAMSLNSGKEYLWLVSVQMVSPAFKSTLMPAAGMLTR